MNKLLPELHIDGRWKSAGLIAFSIAAATLVRVALVPELGMRTSYITFFVAVVYSAWIGGFGGGLWATLASTVIACFFFQAPDHKFSFADPRDLTGCVLFVLESLAISALGEAQRKAHSRAQVHTDRAEASAQSAERSLAIIQENEVRNARVLEVALDCIITINDRAEITEFNPAAEKTFGYAREEVLGKPVADIVIPPALRESHYAGLSRYLATGEGPVIGKRIEITAMRRSGGEFPVELAIIPARLNNRIEFTAYLRDISDRKRAEHELRQAAVRQRVFLRDVLFSVTQGHLRLCDAEEELPRRCISNTGLLPLSPSGGMAGLRHAVRDAARQLGIAEERIHDLVTAAGEAAMNAIVHVGEGEGEVLTSPEHGVVQVRITDQGKGIAFEDLPHATLQKGFTTAGTLGHGMKLMLETTDRVFLLTGETGTTVVLEQYREAPMAAWLM